MNRRNGNRPRLAYAGRGPAVRAVHRMILPVEHGMIRAGWLDPETFRPFPPGAVVVLEVGSGALMHQCTAALIGRALAHCSQITITGTDSRSERGHVDEFGVITGLDVIAAVIDDYKNAASAPSAISHGAHTE